MKESTEESLSLGNAVKIAREHSGITQEKVAEFIGKDSRTVTNIENGKGNPKLNTLYPLVRHLNMDANNIFYPGSNDDSPAKSRLRSLISTCSEFEAEALLQFLPNFLTVLRSQDSKQNNHTTE